MTASNDPPVTRSRHSAGSGRHADYLTTPIYMQFDAHNCPCLERYVSLFPIAFEIMAERFQILNKVPTEKSSFSSFNLGFISQSR